MEVFLIVPYSLFLLFVQILKEITQIEWTEMLDKAHSKCWVNLFLYDAEIWNSKNIIKWKRR
jgi:hypothetical protein